MIQSTFNLCLNFQVAYSSSAAYLSDKQRFVNFFHLHPSDASLGPAILAFLQHYGWKRIIFITQEQSLFRNVSVEVSTQINASRSNILRLEFEWVIKDVFLNEQIYQSVSPVLEMNDIATKNRMVSNSITMVLSSLRQSDFFVSYMRGLHSDASDTLLYYTYSCACSFLRMTLE